MTMQTTIPTPHAPAATKPRTAIPARWACDPLDADAPEDDVVVTTSRRLVRMMAAAADVGARFDRERVGHDPAAWMLAPRAMFDGRPAIEGCQDRRGYMRSVVLHGLSIGLDAAPDALDDLLDAEDGRHEPLSDAPATPVPGGRGAPVLLSAWMDATHGPAPAVHFCAMVTDDPAGFAHRLVDRFGPRAALSAEIQIGFDPTTARATAFLSQAMAHTLELAAAAPASPFAAGLDVVVEQRFSA